MSLIHQKSSRLSALLVIVLLPVLASCDVTHSLRVRRFVSSGGAGPTMTNAVADSILSAATTALRTDDGAGDHPCRVRLGRKGDVGTFTAGDGSIDTPAEFAAVMALPGNVKIVNAINWCGGVLAGILACGDEPGRSFAAVRGGAESLVWAHEFGHNAGLSHRDEWPTLGFAGVRAQGRTRMALIQPWWNDQFLAINTYAGTGAGLSPLWKQEGVTAKPSSFIGLVHGDFDGDGREDLVLLSKTRGDRLGMALLRATPTGFTEAWSADDIGQPAGALAWLVGDIDNDGRANLIQAWANGSHLGMIVNAWNGSAMTTQWTTKDIGQGSSALGWRIGDVDGDGRPDVIQTWLSGDNLGLTLYDWNGSAMRTKWSSTDMGRTTGALAWLVGDVDGDRRVELLQPWSNGGPLGLIVYGWNGSAMQAKWGTSKIAPGSFAMTWLVGDIDGDGVDELLQPWNYGVIVYAWRNGAMRMLWGTGDISPGSGALDWLTGDFNGDGRDELLQLFRNDESLGAILYGWTGTAMTTQWGVARLPPGPDAIMNQTNAPQHTKVSADECYAYRDW